MNIALPVPVLLLLAALPASAIPPALGPPEPEYPLAFDEWKGNCFSRTGCYASRAWGESEIMIGVEPAQPYGFSGPVPAYVRYTIRRHCQPAQRDLDARLPLPLADESDVAAHIRTALQNETSPCGGQVLDSPTAESINRLVRLFTIAGGILPPVRDGPPGETDYNRRPINPDIWIDEVADYPASARDLRQGGRVAAGLTIRNDTGRVMLCDINESSGVAALDEATCRLLKERARFVPGAGVHYVHRVNWDIGRVPVPFCAPCEVGPDGVRRQVEYDSWGRRIKRRKATESR